MESSNYDSKEYAVELEHVSKIYKLKKKDGQPRGSESFYALKISMEEVSLSTASRR